MSRTLHYLKSASEYTLKSRSKRALLRDSGALLGESSSGRLRRHASTAAARRPAPSREFDDNDVEHNDHRSVKKNANSLDKHLSPRRRSGSSRLENDYATDDLLESIPYTKERPLADAEALVAYLRQLLPPLEFPSVVAMQMLTHISAKEAWSGHNTRLSFVGRRALHSYLLLFLHSSCNSSSRISSSSFDFDSIAYRSLHTSLLGEHVGKAWGLARNMLWTPPVSSSSLTASTRSGQLSHESLLLRSPGLYKVQGTTIEGIFGGVFHQFGGAIAQRVFHTRILPHILCPNTSFGIPDTFHGSALDLLERMGGPEGLLISPTSKSAQRRNEENVTDRSAPSLTLSSSSPGSRSVPAGPKINVASRLTTRATISLS